ncbi:ankyrin [Pyrenochaeta sp. DS3sAY3a]|nr:ankyrin [Pyrenochaeta sp. DS3sAY3a]
MPQYPNAHDKAAPNLWILEFLPHEVTTRILRRENMKQPRRDSTQSFERYSDIGLTEQESWSIPARWHEGNKREGSEAQAELNDPEFEPSHMARQLRRDEFTVGWVCALPVELAAAQEMLDEEYKTPPYDPRRDTNIYTCGRVGEHNVVIACLPEGQIGTNSAAAVAIQLQLTFPAIRFGLMVGIGGGVSTSRKGVMVESCNTTLARPLLSGFERTGFLNAPPMVLLNAVANLKARHLRGKNNLMDYLARLGRLPKYTREHAGVDTLFEATYNHNGGATCKECNKDYAIERAVLGQEVNVHYGIIASGNQVIKDAVTRDRVSAELGGVLCFEMEAAGLMNTFPCLVIRGICDYADSHKHDQWQPYAAGTAAAYAKELLSIIPATEVTHSDTAEEVIRVTSKCLKSLAFAKQDSRFHDVHVAQNTCEWLLEHPKYQNWVQASTGLFWVKGNPGAGKSVLMKHIIKKMRELNPSDVVVSFFFYGQGQDLQRTVLGLFRALLSSILIHFPEELAELTASFAEKERRFGGYTENRWEWTENELRQHLSTVLIKGTHQRPVVIFIDALDECGEHSAKKLLAYFQDVAHQAAGTPARFKICISSRHYPILALDAIPSVAVEKMNSGDIQWYTQQRLRQIQPKSKREQIESEIVSQARGGFQWVFLVTETIIDKNLAGFKADKLLADLAVCPKTLSAMYERILGLVPAADQPQMVKLFQWVLFAERPLSAQELRDALSADQSMTYTSILDLQANEGWSDDLDGFERYIKHVSRGLVTFKRRDFWEQYVQGGEDANLEAQLIHQSVADFLHDRFFNSPNNSWPESWTPAGAGQFQISRSCIRYMRLKDLLETANSPRGVISSRFPLAPYAVRFLFVHIRKAEQEGIVQSDLLSTLQWTPNSSMLQKLAIIWRTLDPDSAHTPVGWPFLEATALHVLVAFGCSSAIEMFFKSGGDEHTGTDARGNTPLMIAIRDGHQNIALLLLEQYTDGKADHASEGEFRANVESWDVHLNTKNQDGDTALHIALDQKMIQLVFKLIEAGAEPKYLEQETAFVAFAIDSRNLKLLSLAIEKKLDLDGAVFHALKNRTSQQDDARVIDSIISQLLEAGADTKRSESYDGSRDDWDFDLDEDQYYYDDALMIAARRGLTHLVSLMLPYVSSETRADEPGESALLIATDSGHEEVLPLLLRDNPLAVQFADYDGRTALDAAFNLRRVDMMQILVDLGDFSDGNILNDFLSNYIDNSGRISDIEHVLATVLQKDKSIDKHYTLGRAVITDDDVLVKLLLDTGEVDPNIPTWAGGETPLSLAADSRNDKIVRLLLDGQELDKQAALSMAVELGGRAHAGISLLRENVDADLQMPFRRTLSSIKKEKGFITIVRLLLTTDMVEADSKDCNGVTPLSWAAMYGHEAIIKLLLDTGKVDIESKDRFGWSPLLWAVQGGHGTVMKMLLEYDAKQKNDVQPIYTARIGNAKELAGQTLFSLAAKNEESEFVKFLLDTGKFDINASDDDGWTPLLWAIGKGHMRFVELFIATEEADLNQQGPFERPALWWAAMNRHYAVVNLLLETGKVNVNATDKTGSTLLLWSVQHGDEKLTTLLLGTNKVDLYIKNSDGFTALSWATEYKCEKSIQLLKAYQDKSMEGR